MNVKPLLKEVNPSTFIQDYLKANGIENVERYLNPDDGCFEDWQLYPNIDEAVEIVENGIKNKVKFGLLVDTDSDGFMSSAIIYDLLKDHNIKPTVFFHTSKQHGLKDVLSQILEAKIDIMLVPDAGTSNYLEAKELKECGCTTICFDHHIPDHENPYAIIVNPHLGNRMNTAISGAGVSHKFALTLNGYDNGKYYDMVAMSLVSDVCDLSVEENRAYIAKGLSMLDTEESNPMVNLMLLKLCNRGINPEGLSWGAIPPINALCRGDNQEDKLTFFKALVGEADIDEGLKVARRAHRIQTTTVKEMYERIEPTVDDTHVVAVGFGEPKDAPYIGLCANRVMTQFNKPTLLLREADSTTWSGSLRSPIPLADVINESGLGKAQGHLEAAGVFIPKSKLKRLVAYLDDHLDLSATPDIPVTAKIKPDDITLSLCEVIDKNKILWGHGLECPQFYLKTHIAPSQVQIFTKRSTTIKITIDNIPLILFFAKDADAEALSNVNNDVEFIVELSVNEYMGEKSPQGIIKKYEVHENVSHKEEDWESLF